MKRDIVEAPFRYRPWPPPANLLRCVLTALVGIVSHAQSVARCWPDTNFSFLIVLMVYLGQRIEGYHARPRRAQLDRFAHAVHARNP